MITDLGPGTAGVPACPRPTYPGLLPQRTVAQLIRVARDAGRRGRLRSQDRGLGLFSQALSFELKK